MAAPFLFLIFFVFQSYTLFTCTAAADAMTVNQTIRDGQRLISAQETFEFGFFSPANTTRNRYLGIWYKRQGTDSIAWVANRNTPIANKSGELTLHPDGVLVLRDSSTLKIIWSSGSATGTSGSPVARLFDTGNLMVVDSEGRSDNPDSEDYIWQSFDHPGNTVLPGVKLGRSFQGVVTTVISWKSDVDPSEGEYKLYTNFSGLSQVYENKGDEVQTRVGFWNGLRYVGLPNLMPNPIFRYEYFSNETEVFYRFEPINPAVLTKLVISPGGDIQRVNWINRTQGWQVYSALTTDDCDRYSLCGPYGSCDIEQSPPCRCLDGFTPKNPQEWGVSDWKTGCERTIPLNCGGGEGFRLYSSLKLPDSGGSWYDENMSLEHCKVKCKKECNCTAYSTLDIKYNRGCLLWYGDLIDLRSFRNNGQDIYIRLSATELEKDKKASKSEKNVIFIVIPAIGGLSILLGVCLLMIFRRRKLKAQGKSHGSDNNNIGLPLFSLSKLLAATDNFSDKNKLGEGGFGPVYKGLLEDEREIAVKRLSESSTQGVEEFKNEVIFISKLQHRNLVKILGCCIEGQEKLLVYEYMSNKALDLFLFQEEKRKALHWTQRFRIINGIARGLLYLHQDSRLRIIHRDLKAANILLDSEMNPKISDFGTARCFRGNDNETNTKRVVGTYGYMSPEYAGNGNFSVKSDVFSFGVLVLEIVSGKKNRGFFDQSHNHTLLGHAWRLYKEGKSLEIVDASLARTDYNVEALRSIHVGLLCVQNNSDERPNMSTVLMMLNGDSQLPEPKQPGFYTEDYMCEPQNSSNMQSQDWCNDITVTILEPR